MSDLILASGSPRRRDLLLQLGLDFEICVANIDETVHGDEHASDYVQRLAAEKAAYIATQYSGAFVLGADTCLSVMGEIVGKPQSKQHAFEIWQRLAGRYHDVFTGICICIDGKTYVDLVQTRVKFAQLSLDEMHRYWASGEPADKAGAYAIQGLGAQYIPEIIGSYSNVVGLPLYETHQLLQQAIKAQN